MPLAADIGPADGVLLNSAAGKDPLRVHAKDARIAWGERGTSRVWSVAAVDIDRVMKAILRGSSYEEGRREAQESAKAEEAAFNRRLDELRARYPMPTDGSPPPSEAQQAMAELQQQYSQWLDGVRRRDEKLAAEQFESAYRELVVAVEAVAEKEEIDIVHRFMPTAAPFKVDRTVEAIGQIQARAFLKYPESIDITPEVMKALNLSE